MPSHLLIISHTRHFMGENKIPFGWTPTILENDVIAKSFQKVTIMGELHQGTPPNNFIPYKQKNIEFIPFTPQGGNKLREKIKLLLELPTYFFQIHRQIIKLQKEDWVYVRCPCNIGLIACIYLIFTRKGNRWFKYGGNWDSNSKQPWSYRLQRWILIKNLCKGKVTINGKWNHQPSHLKSLYNPCMTQLENAQAEINSRGKKVKLPLEIIFVGRIEREKGTFKLIEIAEELSFHRIAFQIQLFGDGKDFKKIKGVISKKELAHLIKLRGEINKEELKKYYNQAHFILLPSKSEGWPKVLGEAMSHRCVPISSSVGSIPEILNQFQCGIHLKTMETNDWTEAIIDLSRDIKKWDIFANNAQLCSQQFTYERMELDIQSILNSYG